MMGDLVASSGRRIRNVIADGAYDGAPVYQAIRAARPERLPTKIIIPPCRSSIPDRGQPLTVDPSTLPMVEFLRKVCTTRLL